MQLAGKPSLRTPVGRASLAVSLPTSARPARGHPQAAHCASLDDRSSLVAAERLCQDVQARIDSSDRGLSLSLDDQKDVNGKLEQLSEIGERQSPRPLDNSNLWGNFNVAYTSVLNSTQPRQPAGGRFRNAFGRRIFQTTQLCQSVLRPDVVTNKVEFTLLGLISGFAGLRGQLQPLEEGDRDTVKINFAPPRLSLGGIIDLAIGPADSVQIKTTFLSPSVRVGRGSRGSWFYFTKGGSSDEAGMDRVGLGRTSAAGWAVLAAVISGLCLAAKALWQTKVLVWRADRPKAVDLERRVMMKEDPFAGNERYQKVADLAKGTFGLVVLALDRKTSRQVAIKFIERGQKVTKNVLREIINHKRLNHPHVVRLQEVFLTPYYLAIVMEYAAGSNMFQLVVRKSGLGEAEARWYFQQIIIAVDYCHKVGVANRDIKLENTLLSSPDQPVVKICDFGYSKDENLQSAPGSRVGTPAYLAPEVILTTQGKKYDAKAADVWSCGVMLYIMLTAAYPFSRPEDQRLAPSAKLHAMMQRTLNLDFSIPRQLEVSAQGQDLLRRILVRVPTERLTLQEVMRHPWFCTDLPDGVATLNARLVAQAESRRTAQQEEMHRTECVTPKMKRVAHFVALLGVLALACGLVGAQWPTTDPTLAQWSGPVGISCLCSDAIPRSAFTQNISGVSTCEEFQAEGQCGAPFMLNSVKELPEGYYAAFTAAAQALGVNSISDLSASAVADILQYHLLPPVPFIETTWTTPFFSALSGPIDTSLSGAKISVEPSGSSYTFTGPSNSAKLVTGDIEACKGYVNIIDTVLIPPSGAGGASGPASAASVAPAASPTAAAVSSPPLAAQAVTQRTAG
ncbi:hypothetical protein WJX73_005534 [Symbiochloris irregularis]|uniref:Protein kinase domain-containing protein n=1 Tax=Symbiochloris irregularis TaxID=706552 RepID=A0AAW1PS03_9CHLO